MAYEDLRPSKILNRAAFLNAISTVSAIGGSSNAICWNAGHGKRPPALVSPGTVTKLHTSVIDTGLRENAPPGTPKTGKHALGWGEVTLDWSSGPVLTHAGSNGMNLATVMILAGNGFRFRDDDEYRRSGSR